MLPFDGGVSFAGLCDALGTGRSFLVGDGGAVGDFADAFFVAARLAANRESTNEKSP